jgi:hypothetical protein
MKKTGPNANRVVVNKSWSKLVLGLMGFSSNVLQNRYMPQMIRIFVRFSIGSFIWSLPPNLPEILADNRVDDGLCIRLRTRALRCEQTLMTPYSKKIDRVLVKLKIASRFFAINLWKDR